MLETPPNIGGGWGDLWRALATGNRMRKLAPRLQGAFARLMTKSVGDCLDEWFEFDGLKGVCGFEGIVGNMVSPYAPGAAYVLLHHYFGEVGGKVGAWGHARGGMGAITQAMARSAAAGAAAELLSGTIDIAPSLGYLERAYDDARQRGWAREPIVSMCIPGTRDDTLAPPGAHAASLFCQHFTCELPDGASWDAVKDEAADHIIATVERYAPNFARAVVGRQVLSPLDLEREFGLTGGDIFHGALHPDQTCSLRPAPGHADYRMPVAGLDLCGSGAHPGGGVTGTSLGEGDALLEFFFAEYWLSDKPLLMILLQHH